MRQERKAEARQVGRRRKGRRRKLGEAEEGREGWPFEPGAAFEFHPDSKPIQLWSKNMRDIYMVTKCTNAYIDDQIVARVAHRPP